jgi:hypothetical protein
MVRATIVSLCVLTGCYSGLGGGPSQGATADDGASGPPDATDVSDGSGDDDGGDTGDADAALTPVPMRRLTRAQFVQSTRDLLAIADWTPAAQPPDDGLNEEEFQLPNMRAATVSTPPQDFEGYRVVAKEAAAFAFATDDDVTARLGCAPTGPDDPCVRSYLVALAERAWARPVAEDDPVFVALLAVADDGHTRLGTVRAGLQWFATTLLQSPEFLYVYPTPDADDPSQIDGYSRARLLALMFRDSVPDEVLLARARAGELTDDAVLHEEIDRLIGEMIDDPARRGAVHRFFGDWWSTNVIASIGKDPDAFPMFSETLRASMAREIDAWLDDILFARPGDFRRVLVSDQLWVDAELAALYGIPGEFGSELVPVPIADDSPRSGILSTAAFSSVMAHPAQTSPAARGKFISERLLCLTIPPPPPGVDTELPAPEGPETKRERFARHTTDPTCFGCHQLMDPAGLSLEEFDGIGRHRLTESMVYDGVEYELPLELAGELADVPFANSKEMAAVLADDPRFVGCVTRQLLRQALGRDIGDDEQEMLDGLAASFADADYDFLELMREAAMHEIFTAFEEGA